MTLKAPGVLTPGAPATAPQKRDTRDPYAIPDAPRGILLSPTVHGVHEAEPGAPKGRAPDGRIIEQRTLSKPVRPPKTPAR